MSNKTFIDDCVKAEEKGYRPYTSYSLFTQEGEVSFDTAIEMKSFMERPYNSKKFDEKMERLLEE